MMSNKIYMILCPSYHGATLLSPVVGNHSRIFALGDTIPPRSFLSRRCGCGELIAACAFWQRVRSAVGDDDPVELVSSRPRILSSPVLNTGLVVASGLLATKLGMTYRSGSFVRANEAFLRVCAEFKEFDVFIDGYKSLSRYLALKSTGFPMTGVIHLIRNPQSFVASAKRNRLPIEKSARRWTRFHKAIPLVAKWAREWLFQIRYEDFCADPNVELSRLQLWMDLPPEDLKRPLRKDIHWIGNSSMINFDGQIRKIDTPRTHLTREEGEIVRRITGRRAHEFGYAL
jgi:hypothetical protein